MKKKISEKEIDDLVANQADDKRSWGRWVSRRAAVGAAPIRHRRPDSCFHARATILRKYDIAGKRSVMTNADAGGEANDLSTGPLCSA